MFRAFARVLLLSVLVMSIAAPVFATTSRVNSLAQTGDYINDDSNIFRWYGLLPSYANLVMAEVGTLDSLGVSSQQALGITHSCGDDGKWGTFGLFLLRNSVDDNSFFIFSPISSGVGDTAALPNVWGTVPVNKLALMWGKEFESFSMGFSLTRSDASIEDENVGAGQSVHKTSKSYTTFGAGVRTDLMEKAYADFAFTLGFAGYEEEGGALNQKVKLDKKHTIDLAGRMFYEWKDNVTLVPAVNYFQYEYALANANDPHGSKVRAFSIGGAMNMDVNTNNLIICGAEIWRYKWEWSSPGNAAGSQDENTTWGLPTVFLALESDVKPWLTARIGSWKTLFKETDTSTAMVGGEPSPRDYISTDADFAWFLGVGFHVAEFDVDMEIGPQTPFNLGYWLTGYANYSNGAPVSRISAVYHF